MEDRLKAGLFLYRVDELLVTLLFGEHEIFQRHRQLLANRAIEPAPEEIELPLLRRIGNNLQLSFEQGENVDYHYSTRISGEPVAALRPALTFDNPALLEDDQNLLEIVLWNAVRFGYVTDLHRALAIVVGQLEHCRETVNALCRNGKHPLLPLSWLT